MFFLELLVGIFTAANAFIALFIVIFAFLFLKKTKSHKDRRPWDYLFLASIIYLLFTLFIMLLGLYNQRFIFEVVDVYELSIFFQFVYTGLILLAFISQTDLIFNNSIIVIMKKEAEKRKDAARAAEPTVEIKEVGKELAGHPSLSDGAGKPAQEKARRPRKGKL